jgi:PIN domain nuclease of toxin-antitoxin system
VINLDTHIVLFALAGELSRRERHLLATEMSGISGIVLWEIAKLYDKGKINVSVASPGLRRFVDRLVIWGVDYEVCLKLPELDFASDPADELIAATSLAHNVPLLTRDSRIRSSRKVPLA